MTRVLIIMKFKSYFILLSYIKSCLSTVQKKYCNKNVFVHAK